MAAHNNATLTAPAADLTIMGPIKGTNPTTRSASDNAGNAIRPSRPRLRVQCGHPGCWFNGLKKHLMRHTRSQHPGMAVREKSVLPNITRYFSALDNRRFEGVPSADVTMAARNDVTAAAPSADVTMAARNDVTAAAPAADVTMAARNDVTAAAPAADVTMAARNDVTAAAPSADVTMAARNDVTTNATAWSATGHARGARAYAASSCGDHGQALDELKTNQLHILRLLQPAEKDDGCNFDAPSSGGSIPQTLEIDAGISLARDINALVEASAQQLRCFPEHNIIACITCRPNFEPSQEKDKPSVAGVFHYNVSIGTRFPKPKPLHQAFTQLKRILKSHFAGASNRKKEEEQSKHQEEMAKQFEKNNSVSFRVLRTAFHVLKKSLSRQEFEELVVLQSINGLNVGDLCHSGSQMSRFRDAFGAAVLSAVSGHVRQSPCVSWVADKVTVNSRTLDITAIITIFPEAAPDRLVQSLVIGAPVVTEHDGTSLATEWIRTATTIGITETKKLAAICTDGQFHHGSVPAKFLAKLTESHPDYVERSVPPAVPCLWDGAHLNDLADGAARREPGCSWVNDTVEKISRLTRRFTVGKSRETLRRVSEEQGLPLRGLQLWSETRFSPHAAAVLENFCINMRGIAAAMGEMLDAPSTKGNLVQELASDLRLLTGPDKTFRVRVAALKDVYGVLGRASRSLQNLQLLPWERQSSVKSMVGELKAMATTSRAVFRGRVTLTSSEAIRRELEDVGETEDLLTRWSELAKHCDYVTERQARTDIQ